MSLSVEYIIQAGGGSAYPGASPPFIGTGGGARRATGTFSLNPGTYAAVIAAIAAVDTAGNNSSIFGITASGGDRGFQVNDTSAAGGAGVGSAGQAPPDSVTGGDGGNGEDPFGVGLFPSLGGGGGGAGASAGGGAGSGASSGAVAGDVAANATANTGGAGGGGYSLSAYSGGQGASGRIILRYLTAGIPSGWTITGGSKSVSGSYTYHDITSTGNFVATAPPSLRRNPSLDGLSAAGPFFSNPLSA